VRIARAAAQLLQRLINLPQDGVRVLLEQQTGWCKHGTFAATLEQDGAHAGLQIAELL
jgi:hypothetical protein